MRKRWSRATLASGLVAVAAVLTLVIAGVATGYDGDATKVDTGVSGNPRCPAGTADAGSIKIDGSQLAVGDYQGRIRITARDSNPDRISWELIDHSAEVMAVIVKGGDLANIYYYDGSVTSDVGLTPPLNGGEQNPQISHVEFCFDPKEGPTPHLTVDKSASGTSQITHTWSIDKQVKVAGAADATYGDNASLNLADGGSGSFTWKVTVNHSQSQTYAVSGTITVSNDGDAAVTGVDVTDSLPGASIACGGNGSTNLTVPAHGSVQCTYTVAPGSQVPNNTATASWGTGSTANDTATITWAQPTEVGVPAAVEDDGQIDESLGVDDLTNNAWTTTYDERWTCSKGTPSPNGGRTNTATVTWEGGSDSDSASVQVACGTTPPPTDVCPNLEGNQATVPAGMVKDANGNCVTPSPPPAVKTDEFMDVQVVKDATPQVQLVNGQADVAYTVRVRNNGPNQAHNVQLVDSAPSGVTFTGITQAPVGGGCSLSGGVLLQCSLGTLGPGVERVIGLSARVTGTGTYVNCATATGDGKDTNGANNRACASTLVTAPVTPPTTTPKPPVKPKPKPKPKPLDICRVLKVTPSMVKANGSRQIVLAKVTRSKTGVAGVAVRFTGTGLAKVVKTNGQGIARLSLTPSKAGIMLVKITSAKACNSARIGVVGVFEPPVTG
jgi:uncharacterized repeat protein (TIGR01451 family)